MKAQALWIATCSTALVAGCADSTGPRVDKLTDALGRATVSLKESVLAGESSVSGGRGIRAELLVVAEPEYSVNALWNGALHDVRVSITGAVTATHALGPAADPCPGSIPLADAIGIAEREVNGSAVRVQPDDDDHCLREVQVLSGNKLWEVKLSREGQVLETEEADGDDN